MLSAYGLEGFEHARPSELSGGMRQRAALIRTLALEPDLLLLDEPFSALDYQTRLSVCDDISSILRSTKKTAVLVTHDLSEAISIADRIIILTPRPGPVSYTHLLGNEFITMIKQASLASVFFINELTTSYKTVASATFRQVESIIIAGIIYLLVTTILGRIMAYACLLYTSRVCDLPAVNGVQNCLQISASAGYHYPCS